MPKTFQNSIGYPFRLVALMWLIFIAEYMFHIFPFSNFGIVPRTGFGLLGILFAPLLHGSYMHLLSNSVPLIILGTLIYLFYNNIAAEVFFYCYFLTGALVWALGRTALHIGASGLVYGLAFFLFFIGLSRKDFRSLLISIFTVFFYGGIIYGILPGQAFVSWESHLFGALVGIYCAFNCQKKAKNSGKAKV